MKRTDEYKVTTFIPDWFTDFRVDVVETETTYEAWIYHKDHDHKHFMFGGDKTDINEFAEVVEGNINQYVKDYIEEFMED